MARACRFQFHLGPFRAAFLALLLIACASGMATATQKAEHLYLLAGTPLRDETDSYPVTLYAVGPNGRIETVREIFSKSLGLFGVRDDLEGRLYVMNEWQNILSVIHESDPERDDVVKNNFGCMYETAWGIVAPPGQGSSAIYPNTCATKPWKVVTVAGAPAASSRISEGKGNWSLYRWFRYRGASVTPRAEVMPVGNIAQGRIVVPFQIGFPGSRVVRGRLMPKPVQPGTVGIVGGVPPNLPQSVGTHQWTVEDARGTVHLPTRLAVIVADTPHFFAFAALPVYSKKWPVPVYVQNKDTARWRVIDSPFIKLWPRVSGSWLATTVEEPNPSGKASPGLKNERTLPPYAYKTSDLPQVRGLYGTKTFMPGKLLLQNLVDGRKLTIDTGQQDSEVLDVRKDGLVLYRVNDEIFSAHIEGDKLSAPELVVKGEDVPEVHWVFWSKAGTEGQASASNVQTLFVQLESRPTSSEAAEKLVELGKANAGVRKYLSNKLPGLIERARGLVWVNAVRLAGNLKLDTAAPVLAPYLEHWDTIAGRTDFAVTARFGNDPAGKALVEIGEASVSPVAQVLESGDRIGRWRAARILLAVGSPTAVQALRSHFLKEKDPHLKQFIASQLRSHGAERRAH